MTTIIAIIISVLLSLLLSMTGGGKIAGMTASTAIRDSLHVPASQWKLIGVLEIMMVLGLIVGIWFPLAGFVAAIGVVALMLGAIAVRVRAFDGNSNGIIADAVILVIAAGLLILRAQNLSG
jgi:uncharacterized membrane protein YphA (DoxX/SURF4 family)